MQMKIADIRGWGYLTGKGIGALGLPPEKAREIQNANARLIAAAPEMYRLLYAFLKIDEQKIWASTEKNDPAYMIALVAQNDAINMTKRLLARIDVEDVEA